MKNFSKIYALLKFIEKDDDWLHSVLPDWTGKSSLKDLSTKEYYIVVNNLEELKKQRSLQHGYLTEKQEWKINFFKEQLGMKTDALNAFILRTTGDIDSVNKLKIGEASAVITGLSKLQIRNNK